MWQPVDLSQSSQKRGLPLPNLYRKQNPLRQAVGDHSGRARDNQTSSALALCSLSLSYYITCRCSKLAYGHSLLTKARCLETAPQELCCKSSSEEVERSQRNSNLWSFALRPQNCRYILGYVVPAYHCFKAIELNQADKTREWSIYWYALQSLKGFDVQDMGSSAFLII